MENRKKHFKVIRDYLKTVTSQYKHLQYFTEINPVALEDLLGDYKRHNLVEQYGLSLYDYKGSLNVEEQKTLDHVTVSLCVFTKIKNSKDDAELNAALSGCEVRAMDVLARIRLDSLVNPDLEWLYEKFVSADNSVEYALRIYQGAFGLVGFEFHFDLKINNPLILNQADWEDYEIPC